MFARGQNMSTDTISCLFQNMRVVFNVFSMRTIFLPLKITHVVADLYAIIY